MAKMELTQTRSADAERISAVLLFGTGSGVKTFAALPSNCHALDLADRFMRGLSPFCAVVGPSGWGKSELLNHMAGSLSQVHGRPIEVVDAVVWARFPSRPTSEEFLLLDDLQDVMRHPKAKHQLRLRLEQRFRFKKPTFVTMVGSSHDLLNHRILGSLGNWEIESIQTPSRREREQIVSQIAHLERVRLSAELTHLIAAHMNGNGRSIRGALLRLKLIRPDWTQLSHLAEASGILMPYLIGADGWDLRDVVRDAVMQTLAGQDTPATLTENHICAYLLRHEIHLREHEVATFLRLSPGEVYRLCNQTIFALTMPENALLMNDCRTAVFRALSDQ